MLIRELARTRHRVAIARRARSCRPVPDPVFLLSVGRTGSQLLTDYLNNLPGVSMRDEVLNDTKVVGLPRRLVTARGVEEHLHRSVASLPGPVRGAKLLLSQLEHRGLDAGRLRELFPDVRFIVLYRRSLAEQYVSLRLAETTGVFADRGQASGSATRIEVDADDVLRYFDRVKARYRRLLAPSWMEERSRIVCYEDLVADPEAVVGGMLCPFLAVSPGPLVSLLKKQNHRPLTEVVANFGDVGEILTGGEARHDYR